MSDKIEKCAFPRPIGSCVDGTFNPSQTGMSLRDYFAAKAINSIMLHPMGKAGQFDEVAEDAYRIADAMMEARKQ